MTTYATRPYAGRLDFGDTSDVPVSAEPRPASWKASRARVRRPHDHQQPKHMRPGFRGPVGSFDHVSVMSSDIRMVFRTERNRTYPRFSKK